MKSTRLLFHFGYPKTATTTFQKCVLNHDSLNNIGKPLKAAEEIFKQIVASDANENSSLQSVFEYFSVNIDRQKLNVYSHEGLVAGEFDSFAEIAARLRRLADRLEMAPTVMITLRRQDALLVSLFIERNYHKLRTDGDFRERFVSDPLNMVRHYAIFENANMYRVVSILWQAFGRANVVVLFYEDLLSGADRYYDDLSAVLGVESSDLRNRLGGNSLNTKAPNGHGYILQGGHLIDKARKLSKWLSFDFKRLYVDKMNLYNSVKTRLLAHFSSEFVPIVIGREQKNAILKEFYGSNDELHQCTGWDALKEHGYVTSQPPVDAVKQNLI